MSYPVYFSINQNIEDYPHNLQYFFTSENVVESKDLSNFTYLTDRKQYERRFEIPVALNPFNQTPIMNLYKIPKRYIQPYTPSVCIPKSTFHDGQLKLLLSTLYFFKHYVPNGKHIVVYAGAAHGFNIGLNIYPSSKVKKWILVDPSKNWDKRLLSRGDVEIIRDFFTDDLAKQLKDKYKNENLVFLSDIRINPYEKDIKRDNINQLNWVKILKPVAYCLKLRFPYILNEHTGTEGKYLTGDVIIQPYAPLASTESRLMKQCGKRITLKKYNFKEHEDRFFTFNRFIRPCDFSDGKIDLRDYGYDNCFDCTVFYNIVKECFPKENTIEKMKFIQKNLVPGSLYKVFTDIKEKKRTRVYKKVFGDE